MKIILSALDNNLINAWKTYFIHEKNVDILHEDITNFVHEQYEKVKAHHLDDLEIPFEEVITLPEESIIKRLGICQS